MKKVLIIGAEPIGRGFLAPLLQDLDFQINFLDKDINLVKRLNKRGSYLAAITNNKNYIFKKIILNKAYNLKQKLNFKDYDIVFCCVGPKQCGNVAKRLKNAKTIISCENDFFSVTKIKNIKE